MSSWTLRDAAAALAPAIGHGDAAQLAATALIEAEILGQPRFGLDLLAELQQATLEAERPTAALSLVECAGRFGPLAVANAVLGLQRVTAGSGLAAVWLRGLRGVGRLAPFLRAIADSGQMALAAVQAPPFVAPAGGHGPVVGTNPIGFAAGQGADQLVIDISTSALTMAAFKQARASGDPLPPAASIDSEGQPTTDAARLNAALARGGRIGSLMGLMAEVLAGVAGDARNDSTGRGLFLLSLEPQRLHPEGWTLPLAELRASWAGAGGHWPSGRPLSPDTQLPDAAAARFDDWLKRLADPSPRKTPS